MKRIKVVLSCYLVLLLVFVFQKSIFLLYHYEQSSIEGLLNCLKVLWYGLSMDMTVAGYGTVIPALVILVSCFISSNKCLVQLLKGYLIFVSILIPIIFIPDLVLYSYWGFRIDSTIFTYVVHPKEVTASLSIWEFLGVMLSIIITSFVVYYILKQSVLKPYTKIQKLEKRIPVVIAMIALLGLLFIAIRGGLGTSTMNVSRVYFSERMYLNHAAINPYFSLFSSVSRTNEWERLRRFMNDDDAERIVKMMLDKETPSDSVPELFNTTRPNIIFILLESFGNVAIESLGGIPNITPNLDRLSEEGIFFRRMSAGSFRTDRGIVCALSGYPAQPTMSIIKYPEKTQTLRSVPYILKEAGYGTSFLYGGDLNFAYIKSYLVTQGIVDFTQDTDFAVNQRKGNWGAHDDITFERLFSEVKTAKEPYFKGFLTLSSHEPFDVPYHKFEDPYLNSVAYTDSCIGVFIDKLKQLPEWKNTLVVLVPDHDMMYPSTIQYNGPERFDIFSLWLGGAIKQPLKVDRVCSQIDIAATLLSQLKLDFSQLPFSRDIFRPATREYAFYDFPDGFGIVTPNDTIVYDCETDLTVIKKGENIDSLLLQGKAYLQYIFQDIKNR